MSGALALRPPVVGCPRALVADGMVGRIVARPEDLESVVACFDGTGAPPLVEVTSERVDALAEGALCEARLRFTFRHDGVVIASRCGDDGAWITAEVATGTAEIASVDDASGATLHVPWAGDWDGDGALEWITEVRGPDGALRLLTAHGLDADDRVVPRARPFAGYPGAR